MAAIFTFDYDFPTTRSRRGTISSISSKEDPVTPALYSPYTPDAIMEISTDDMRRVYPIQVPSYKDGMYEFSEMQTPVSAGLAGSFCEAVVEEPETPVKPASATRRTFFPASLIIEEEDIVEDVAFSASPISRHGKIHPFSGGRRRASISAVANANASSRAQVAESLVEAGFAGAGGLAKMMAFEEIESRGGSDVEDFTAAEVFEKKRQARRRKSSVSAHHIRERFAAFTFEDVKEDHKASSSSATASDDEGPFTFKFEKKPVSSYSCSPSSSNAGSDDEGVSSRAASPRPSGGLGALLNGQAARPGDFLSIVTDAETGKVGQETEIYEVALDEDFVCEEVKAETQSLYSVEEEPVHEHKVCADDFEQLKILGKGTYVTPSHPHPPLHLSSLLSLLVTAFTWTRRI